MTAQDAFKLGFLSRCVEDRVPPAQMLERAKQACDLLKQASVTGLLGGLLNKGVDVAQGVGSAALGYGVPAAIVAPPVLGGLAGYGLARATDIDDTDVAEIKDREVLDAYQRQAHKLRWEKAVRDYHKARTRTGRVFL